MFLMKTRKPFPTRVDRIIPESRSASVGAKRSAAIARLKPEPVQEIDRRGQAAGNQKSGDQTPEQNRFVFASRGLSTHAGEKIKALPLFVFGKPRHKSQLCSSAVWAA